MFSAACHWIFDFFLKYMAFVLHIYVAGLVCFKGFVHPTVKAENRRWPSEPEENKKKRYVKILGVGHQLGYSTLFGCFLYCNLVTCYSCPRQLCYIISF